MSRWTARPSTSSLLYKLTGWDTESQHQNTGHLMVERHERWLTNLPPFSPSSSSSLLIPISVTLPKRSFFQRGEAEYTSDWGKVLLLKEYLGSTQSNPEQQGFFRQDPEFHQVSILPAVPLPWVVSPAETSVAFITLYVLKLLLFILTCFITSLGSRHCLWGPCRLQMQNSTSASWVLGLWWRLSFHMANTHGFPLKVYYSFWNWVRWPKFVFRNYMV